MPADPCPDQALADQAPAGLLVVGQLFADVVFGALPGGPRPGHEIWTSSFGHGPGGIANFAVAGARLGVPTAIAAAVGTDPFSLLVRAALAAEGVSLDHLVTLDDWALPVTASLSYDDDRALVTGGVPCTLGSDELVPGEVPAAAAALVHLDPQRSAWIGRAAAAGTDVYADVGWDPSERWDPAILDQLDQCHAFVPNELEASAYTGTDSAVQAARALAARVPLSVVTSGSRGVVAVDAGTGEEVVRPPLAVRAVDATGAGDVFGASLAASARAPWTLTERVDFACLVAGITVTRPGGASGAPRLDELVPWLRAHPDAAEPGRYDYLAEALAGPDAAHLLA
ncbi:carbohydrate kinase family protein [Clavibacter nebraskensis]|uniref:Carbohydrate kinase n=2 Tax=Clavibacter nebraskensis TaxID=31963 RepID=A0AAI8ZG04_9MICO|nr:PfkB family carbohydrate kinase [Clavibacter nebraskensis]KXU21979.1 carbohydrate kinase [Clavibacter nebraskensis]OAH18763.1 carbohydrate kinase [Clavibacter nebraskensis]QGV65657.1 carbohydrate kinase family protein [Clavibacter nebraskensis]QGV68453.1 carbohydrate kinase family protein [Clavibacter nebraskensis]QGV71244.1 carbohydrate kinase family protein [Clavibacter nebraskensis]